MLDDFYWAAVVHGNVVLPLFMSTALAVATAVYSESEFYIAARDWIRTQAYVASASTWMKQAPTVPQLRGTSWLSNAVNGRASKHTTAPTPLRHTALTKLAADSMTEDARLGRSPGHM
ncbi:hypothetical protein EDB89DRAFT_1917213 [Lactarius sanguifluus]|nr:hypothetical protein EDB89DRAFT_1917213 [Lactarius sanguifluus]